MIQIGSDLLAALSANTYTVSGVTAKDFYSVSAIVCPQLTLDELPGNDGVYLENQPTIVRNVFTLEAYAKNMMVAGKPMTKKASAMLMITEADKVLTEQFGLTMQGEITIAPYTDATIIRAVARYIAYIDTRNNTILRGII
jgi:hypothetical protein